VREEWSSVDVLVTSVTLAIETKGYTAVSLATPSFFRVHLLFESSPVYEFEGSPKMSPVLFRPEQGFS